MTNTLHAHVSTSSVDCDGRISREYVAFFNEDERAKEAKANGVNDFSDIHFMERILLSVASPYSTYSTNINITDRGITSNESTEEGGRYAEVIWCKDNCENIRSYRDHRAEEAGY